MKKSCDSYTATSVIFTSLPQEDTIKIRFKFKGDPEIRVEHLTRTQFEGIRQLPIMDFCEEAND